MTAYKSIPTPVGLHDGNLIRYERHRGQLIANISAWDASKLTLVFRDVWMVKEFDAIGPANEIEGSLSDLRECFDSTLIEEAKRRMKDIHYSDAETNKLRHFALYDDADTPVLEVIAYSIEIR